MEPDMFGVQFTKHHFRREGVLDEDGLVLPHSAFTHRFYEFTVVHQVPLVFDLVGCHPRLDLVPKTLEDQKNKNGGSQSGGGRERGREKEGERERDTGMSTCRDSASTANRLQILMKTELKRTLPLAECDDI